jgi:hypothetical protein
MLTVLRDDQNRITTACDWYCVNENGEVTPNGKYIYVSQLESNKDSVSLERIRDIIADIAWRCPWAVAAYWERKDKTGERLHAYMRTRLLGMKLKEVV